MIGNISIVGKEVFVVTNLGGTLERVGKVKLIPLIKVLFINYFVRRLDCQDVKRLLK